MEAMHAPAVVQGADDTELWDTLRHLEAAGTETLLNLNPGNDWRPLYRALHQARAWLGMAASNPGCRPDGVELVVSRLTRAIASAAARH